MIANLDLDYRNLPNVTITTFPNGLKHVHVEVHNTATFSARIGINAGHTSSNLEDSGVAHFLEHLVFSGTTKYPDRKILSDLIDFVGGGHNASTSWHLTQYYANTLAKDIDNALDFLSQIIVNPLLRSVDFDREKNIILDESKGKLSSIRYLSWVELQKLYYLDELWHTSAVGTPDQVIVITLEQIKEFYDKFYRPNNACLATAGPLSADQASEYVTKYFGNWQSSSQNIKQSVPILRSDNEWFGNYNSPMAEQSLVTIIKPGPSEADVDDFSQSIANCILGGQSYSRLWQSLREDHGLSYGLGTDFTRHLQYGTWEFSAGLDPKNLEKFSQLYRQIIIAFSKVPITEIEMQRAKNDYLASLLFESERTSSLTAMWLEDVLHGTNYPGFTELVQAIQGVTIDATATWIENYRQSPAKILVTSKDPVDSNTIKELIE